VPQPASTRPGRATVTSSSAASTCRCVVRCISEPRIGAGARVVRAVPVVVHVGRRGGAGAVRARRVAPCPFPDRPATTCAAARATNWVYSVSSSRARSAAWRAC
jgi:hypothetical protein